MSLFDCLKIGHRTAVTTPLLAASADSNGDEEIRGSPANIVNTDLDRAMEGLFLSRDPSRDPVERKVNRVYNQSVSSNLSHNYEKLEVTQETLQGRSLALICAENSNLKELRIIDAEIVNADLLKLAEKLTKLEVIQLINCSRITDAGIRYLANIPSLRTLELYSMVIRGEFGSAFIEHKNLQNVILRLCPNLNDEELFGVVSLPNLKKLAIQSSNIKGNCFCALTVKSKLEFIDLFDSPNITNKAIQYFKCCLNLKTVEVCGRNITAQAFKNWGWEKDDRELEELILPCCPKLISEAFQGASLPTRRITLRSRGNPYKPWSTLRLRDNGYEARIKYFSF